MARNSKVNVTRFHPSGYQFEKMSLEVAAEQEGDCHELMNAYLLEWFLNESNRNEDAWDNAVCRITKQFLHEGWPVSAVYVWLNNNIKNELWK